MARSALITVGLAIFLQTCNSEFAYPYTEAKFLKQPSVVYVPVCTPECFKSSHQTHQSHFTPISAEKAHFGNLPLQNHEHQLNYHQLEGYQHQVEGNHHADSGSASVYQQSDHHGSEHKHSIHHHGSGESHQMFKQEHQHHGLEDDGQHYNHEHHHHEKDKNINYKFEYSVNDHKTGDVKHHKEERQGDAVNGEYSLLEEDGNVRTVKYFADWKSGFHAQVHNSKPRSHG
ncbi:histidine-rich glycoprotein-like [Tribolium madens]|uniref:histidine-rich glycoprotein-like n=1 Tax=Tribolium madens TaxID=41895 RepID=UPI001CF72DAF|nr:histidine-rich glycoprotein-like [Tribolium madens]